MLPSDPDSEKFVPPTPEELEALNAVAVKVRTDLLRESAVAMVDVGYRWKDGEMLPELAVRVHLRPGLEQELKVLRNRMPRKVYGVTVELMEERALTTEAPPAPGRLDRHDPLIGGISIGDQPAGQQHPARQGTLGAVVYDAATWAPMALSNKHVIANDEPPAAGIGATVYQPFPMTPPYDDLVIGRVDRVNKALDAAVVKLSGNRRSTSNIFGTTLHMGITGAVDPVPGMIVAKSGVATNTTYGRIEGVDDGAHSFSVVPLRGGGGPICATFDSGSVWIELQSHAAVGLHNAHFTIPGTSQIGAHAHHIRKVQELLGVTTRRKTTLSDGSPFGPAVTNVADALTMAWARAGTLRIVVATTSDGRVFGEPNVLPDCAASGLALAPFAGKLWMAWMGLGNDKLNVMWSADAGSSWNGKVTFDDRHSRFAPALCELGGKLYVAWLSREDGRVHLMRSQDGASFGDEVALEAATAGPTLAAFNGRLLVAYNDAAQRRLVVRASADGKSFNAGAPQNASSSTAPCLHVHRGRAYLAWRGDDNGRYHLLDSADGDLWQGWMTLRATGYGSPSLASLGERFVWSYVGSDQKRSVNVLLYDL